MNGCTEGQDWRLIGAILAGLFFYGMAYNALIHALGERKEGYTSLLVVGGVLITLLGTALVSWQCALLVLAMFTASGIPMIIGEVIRAVQKREEVLKALREGRNDD